MMPCELVQELIDFWSCNLDLWKVVDKLYQAMVDNAKPTERVANSGCIFDDVQK